MGELPREPSYGAVGELPPTPALDDPLAVDCWREAILDFGEVRGEERGRQLGREEGIAEGEVRWRMLGLRDGREEGRREERARAIVDVLRKRGVAMSDLEARQIIGCRDDATLERWWEWMPSVSSAAELISR